MTHAISLAASPVFTYGPVSQPCTMENSKCSKGNSRSPWPGPVILVRVLPLFFLEHPRATWHDFHPRRYILPLTIVATISRRREIYILYRFHAIADGLDRSYRPHLRARSSPRISSLSRFLHSDANDICEPLHKTAAVVIPNSVRTR